MPPPSVSPDSDGSRSSRGVPPSPWLALAVILTLGWMVLTLHTAAGSPLHLDLVRSGFGLFAIDIGSFCRTSLRHFPSRVALQNEEPDPGPEPPVIARSERARWAWASYALLAETKPTLSVEQLVELVRVGVRGVELLLAEVNDVAPTGFVASEGGLVWLLDPCLSLDELPALDLDALSLTELGDDDEATYFVPAERDDPGYFDDPGYLAQPAEGAVEEAARAIDLLEDAEIRILEPYGLRLVPPVDHRTADNLLGEVPKPEEEDLLPAPTAEPPPIPAGDLPPSLVPPGKVEVRILCERPQLVGELAGTPTLAAIDFVAYLATHGHRVSLTRLRDALGAGRADTSRSAKTIWNAAAAARRVLGSALVPTASGNDLYLLAEEVTCDWERFKRLRELATCATSEDVERQALAEALSLVEGIPGLASRRFGWLDAEGLLSEISLAVLDAAHRLAERIDGDETLVALAIEKGRLMLPSDPELVALEERRAINATSAD